MPFFVAYKVRKRIKGASALFLSIFLSFILMILFVFIPWLGFDWYLDFQVAKLDRNSDGFFAYDEIETWTQDEQATWDRYIGDGGRNTFLFMLFPIFSVVYSTVVGLFYWLVATFWLRCKNAF